MAIALERMILEVERYHLGVRRNCIDPLFATSAEQLQSRTAVHFWIVELRGWRRIRDVAAIHLDRIGIGGRDVTMPRDILIQFDMHDAVIGERMHAASFGLARLEEAKGLG